MKTYTEQYAGVAKGLLNTNAEQFIDNALEVNSLEPLKAYKHYLKTLRQLDKLHIEELTDFVECLTTTLEQLEVKPSAIASLKAIEYLMLKDVEEELVSFL